MSIIHRVSSDSCIYIMMCVKDYLLTFHDISLVFFSDICACDGAMVVSNKWFTFVTDHHGSALD